MMTMTINDTTVTELFEAALGIAVEAHRGQVDKGGEPYVTHPIRVAFKCRSADAKVVALLHDVLEDGGSVWTAEALGMAGIPARLVRTVLVLTKAEGESYDEYLGRVALNPLAVEVKLADLEDNMDVRRLGGRLTPNDAMRLDRYVRAWALLKWKEG